MLFSELYKIMVNKDTFVGFRDRRSPQSLPGSAPYLGVAFASDDSQNKETDTRIGKANTVLRELQRSVVVKLKLSNTAKLSIVKSAFVPIPNYCREFWVTTERALSQVQLAKL